MPPGASRAEAQARRALRWYGPSWREAHGDELLTTVLDVEANEVQGDNRRGLSTSTRLELALAGLGQRLRARPPLRTRMRLVRGRGELTWEGLAWLRDILDQRGHALRTVAFAVLMLVTVQLGAALARQRAPKASFPQSGCSLRSPSCCYLSWSVIGLGRATALRSRAIRRAGLTHWGWPVAWNPPPPTRAMSTSPLGATSTRRGAPVVPPATRWVTGELRLVLATCTVGGVLSSASAYVLYARNSRPATPFGYAFAPHVYDLAPVAFLVAALCGIAGTFVSATSGPTCPNVVPPRSAAPVTRRPAR